MLVGLLTVSAGFLIVGGLGLTNIGRPVVFLRLLSSHFCSVVAGCLVDINKYEVVTVSQVDRKRARAACFYNKNGQVANVSNHTTSGNDTFLS
jgi:hypothetical protein